MKKSHPRTIAVKMLLNPDEYLAFDHACAAEDVSHSRAARSLVRSWLEQRSNDRQGPRQMKWPSVGQNMAMLLPGRQQLGAASMRLRL